MSSVTTVKSNPRISEISIKWADGRVLSLSNEDFLFVRKFVGRDEDTLVRYLRFLAELKKAAGA